MQPFFSRHYSSFSLFVLSLINTSISFLPAGFCRRSSIILSYLKMGKIGPDNLSRMSCWFYQKKCGPHCDALTLGHHYRHNKNSTLHSPTFCFPVFVLLGGSGCSGSLDFSLTSFFFDPNQSIYRISSLCIDYLNLKTGENFFSALFPNINISAFSIFMAIVFILVRAFPPTHRKPPDIIQLEDHDRTDLQILDDVQFWEEITQSEDGNISKETVSTLRSILLAVEEQDGYSMGHSIRVMQLARLIALKIGLSTDKIKNVQSAAILHDIGKVEIGFPLLQKRDKLTESEYDIVRQHPLYSVSILEKFKVFSNLHPIILHHHEWYNGQGYPSGIKNVRIPIESRVISVADALDGMRTYRPYKDIKTLSQILRELERLKGIQFDPEVSEAAIDLLSDDTFRSILDSSLTL